MYIALIITFLWLGTPTTQTIADNVQQPNMTMMACTITSQETIAKYLADNYPGAKLLRWQCQFGSRKPPPQHDI